MKNFWLFLVVITPFLACIAQESEDENIKERTVLLDDPFYREDHFYAGVSHSILQDKPKDFSQRALSPNIVFGFLRDIPVNSQRNWAIAPGVGLSYQSVRSNFVNISPQNNDYQTVDDYSKNQLNMWYVDVPVELRWRTSTMHSHKFWRIYLGFKYSYLLHSKSVYQGDLGKINVKNNPDINRSMFGTYLSAGFNTWNAYVYYSFTPIYKENGYTQRLQYFNLGLMFYIL